MNRPLLALALAACLVLPARADLVELDNGNTLEGRVVTEGDEVVIEMGHGRIAVPKERVVRIVRQETPGERFDAYIEGLDATDAKAHWELAEWARERGLRDERRRVLERLLAIDPDHEPARKALGFFRFQNRWVTEDEYMAALGFVRHENRWVSREERERILVEEAVRRERELWQAELASRADEFSRREAELLGALRALESENRDLHERIERRPLVIKRFIQVPVPVPTNPPCEEPPPPR